MTLVSTDVTARRRRTKSSGHREAALDAALHLASGRGLEAISIGGVAARASLPKATVQSLFANRISLQLAALDRGVERFAVFLGQADALPADPLDRLSKILDVWMSFVTSRQLPGGCLVTSSLAEVRTIDAPLRQAVLAKANEWKALVLSLLAGAKVNCQLRENVDPETVFQDLRAAQLAANLAASIGDGFGVGRAEHRMAAIIADIRNPA